MGSFEYLEITVRVPLVGDKHERMRILDYIRKNSKPLEDAVSMSSGLSVIKKRRIMSQSPEAKISEKALCDEIRRAWEDGGLI